MRLARRCRSEWSIGRLDRFLSSSGAAEIKFRYAMDNSPLDVTPKPGETLTDAVQEFRKTGQNPYNGKPEALAEGKKLYAAYCQVVPFARRVGPHGREPDRREARVRAGH